MNKCEDCGGRGYILTAFSGFAVCMSCDGMGVILPMTLKDAWHGAEEDNEEWECPVCSGTSPDIFDTLYNLWRDEPRYWGA
jgi:RecJ-like exonuclease